MTTNNPDNVITPASQSSAPCRLSIMADDFGLHPAVNAGIVETFLRGLLTDANVMAPCSALKEAAELARRHKLPVGMHSTFTCDFDLYRWGPLTPMKTLVAADGRFQYEHEWGKANVEEARRELFAQYDALRGEGLELTHLSEHMGVDDGGTFAALQAELALAKNLPHRSHTKTQFRTFAPLRYAIDGFVRTSSIPGWEKRKRRLREMLAQLQPGSHHIWVVHPAADHPALDRLASADSRAFVWARPYRALDRALLLDPEVKQWLVELNIVPTPIQNFPIFRANGS